MPAPLAGATHVRVFDTTLRDGEQAPGCTMSVAEKLDAARQWARLRGFLRGRLAPPPPRPG